MVSDSQLKTNMKILVMCWRECRKNSRSKELYPVVVLALATGMRRSEVLWLRWKQVNLEQGIILLEQTKNNEPRIIPLQGFTLELLQAKKEESDQLEDLRPCP